MDIRTVTRQSWTAGMRTTATLMRGTLATMADMLGSYGHGEASRVTKDCAQGASGILMIARDVESGRTDEYERTGLLIRVDVLADLLAEGRYRVGGRGMAGVARVAWLHGMMQAADLMASHLDMLERTGVDAKLLAYARGIVSKTRGVAWLLLVAPSDEEAEALGSLMRHRDGGAGAATPPPVPSSAIPTA